MINKLENRNRNCSAGFTLVEMMIAMVISVLIGGWAFSTYTIHHKVFSTESQLTDVQFGTGSAMEMMTKDIRESGFGVPDSPNINGVTTSLSLTDSGTNGGPDSLTLLGGYKNVGSLTADVAPGNNSFTITWANGTQLDTSTKSNISIDGLSFLTVTNVNNNTITVAVPIDRFYPAGRNIYLIENVSYFITGNTLFRSAPSSSPGGEPVMENVDDIQVLAIDTDADGNNDALRLSILARTEREVEQKLEPGTTSTTLENNTVTTSDYFRRRLLSHRISLRNPLR